MKKISFALFSIVSLLLGETDKIILHNGKFGFGTALNLNEIIDGKAQKLRFESSEGESVYPLTEVREIIHHSIKYPIHFGKLITSDIDTSKTIFTISKDKLNKGVYRTLGDYWYNRPFAPSDSFFLKEVMKADLQTYDWKGNASGEINGNYFQLKKRKGDNPSKYKPWKILIDGEIWGYSDGNVSYRYSAGYLSPIFFTDTLIWYSTMSSQSNSTFTPGTPGYSVGGGMVVGGSPAMMSSGPSTVSEKIYLIDSTQNEEIELNREMLVSILSRYPDLQQAYTEASKSDQRNKLAQKLLGSCDPIMTRYFFRYIRRLKIEQRYIEQ